MLDLSIMFIAISVFSQGMEATGILRLLIPLLEIVYAQLGNIIIVVLAFAVKIVGCFKMMY